MNILVTGGIGNIGIPVVKHLLQRGHEVRVIDYVDIKQIEPENAKSIQKAAYQQVDIRDYQKVIESMDGIETIVHLAAIPHPINGKEEEIFQINVNGTYNVYQAAVAAGIHKVISASSINYLGNGYGRRWIEVEYFPIDESHPGLATDVYAFSKQLLERIAEYFWLRYQITSACLRFPFVYNPLGFTQEWKDRYLKNNRESYTKLMNLPQHERKENASRLLDIFFKLRKDRINGQISLTEMRQTLNDIPGGMLMFGHDDFWTYLHVEDAALAIEKAIFADFRGSHPFFIAASNNPVGLPSRDLADLFYPGVNTWKRDIPGTEALLNLDKAKTMLNFEAKHQF
jgi:nucleoside-diphosphate-sugar epimerase